MKRSEMVKLLQHFFYKHANDCTCCNNDNDMYSNILTDLENSGMLPPPSNIINPHRYGDDCFTIEVEYRGQDVSKEFPFETWEPELPAREETGQ